MIQACYSCICDAPSVPSTGEMQLFDSALGFFVSHSRFLCAVDNVRGRKTK